MMKTYRPRGMIRPWLTMVGLVALAWPALARAQESTSRRVLAWDEVNGLAMYREWKGPAAAQGQPVTYALEYPFESTARTWTCSGEGDQVRFCPAGLACHPGPLESCDWGAVHAYLRRDFAVQKWSFGREGEVITPRMAVRRTRRGDWYVAEREGRKWQRLLWLRSPAAAPGLRHEYRLIEARRTAERLLVIVRDEGASGGHQWSRDRFVVIPRERKPAEWQRALLTYAKRARDPLVSFPLFRTAAEVRPLRDHEVLLAAMCAAEAQGHEELGARWLGQASRHFGPPAMKVLRELVAMGSPCALPRTHRLLEAGRGARPAPAQPRAAPGPNPGAATQGMMIAMAEGRLPLERFVDRRAGVVFIDDFAPPAEDPPPRVSKLVCGDELDAFLHQQQRRMLASEGVHDSYEDGTLECHNKPGPPTCTYGRLMEYSPAVHYIFRVDPARGLMLTAITTDDEVLSSDEYVKSMHEGQARTIERLTRSGCPAQP